MDPFRNLALHNSKLQSLLQGQHHHQSTTSGSEMPPPPAYHMVVDPTAPLPNMRNPYDADDEEKEDDDTPEININAMTQVRGHGNIISVAQMDSVRIANLIVSILHGTVPPSPSAPAPQAAQPEPTGSESTSSQTEHASSTHRTQHDTYRPRSWRRDARHIPKVNVTVNCGATVIGDRNIVGPGLGDIARHMQMAQRSQMVQRQQMLQQQQQQHVNAARAAGIPNSGLGFLVGAHVPIATPPMSRSSSVGSQASNGLKRKMEESIEEVSTKRTC
jgi:hypothetical protein